MKKIKKIIALGLAAMAAVSAMSVSAFAKMEFTDGTVETSIVSVENSQKLDFTDGTVELFDTSNYFVEPRATGTLFIDDEIITDNYRKSFTCTPSLGNNLNIFLRNTGSIPIKCTLKSTTASNSEIITLSAGQEVTKRYNNETGMRGTWTISVTNQDLGDDGVNFGIKVRARQY
ncbi:MAG: hypothetical protein Q4G33_13470 [bacterium]|nr:hypothetical protein [bacterium]